MTDKQTFITTEAEYHIGILLKKYKGAYYLSYAHCSERTGVVK